MSGRLMEIIVMEVIVEPLIKLHAFNGKVKYIKVPLPIVWYRIICVKAHKELDFRGIIKNVVKLGILSMIKIQSVLLKLGICYSVRVHVQQYKI